MTNKYEDIGRQMVADEDRARASVVEFAGGTSPEQEVEIRSLAQKTGAPAEAVRADPDGARLAAERARLAALSPTTQRWLTENPSRYALVKDDVGTLDKLGLAIGRTFETAQDNGLSAGWRTLSDHLARWDTIGRAGEAGHSAAPDPFYVEEVVSAIFAGHQRGIGNAGFGAFPDLGNDASRATRETVARGLGFADDAAHQATRSAGFMANQERRAQGIERASAATDAQFQNIAAANEADSLWQALGLVAKSPRAVGVVLGQSVGMGAPGLAMTAATGGMGRPATMAAAGGSSGLVEYGASISESLGEAGVDLTDAHSVARALRNPALMGKARDKAAKRGVTIGLFDAATAGLAGHLLINARRGVASAALRTGGEVGIQAGGGAAGELAAQLVTGEDLKMGDIILEGIAELPFGAVEARANYVSARERGQVRWINEQLDIVRRSSAGAESLQAATAAAAEAKLGQRSPDEARAFAQAAGAEGAIYIDAEAARTLFQSDWQVLVDAVGGDATLTEQLAAGDVAIPAAEYFARIAQLPNAPEIARHARAQADALSAVELDEYDVDALADAMAGDTSEAAERAKPGEATTRQRVQDDVYGQLLATDRFTDSAAQAQAKLWGAFFASMESRYGTDGWAAYERYMKGINTARADGKADPRSTRPWQGDGQLDALLDAIRTGNGPDQAKMRGPSLAAFVQGLGGINDDTGELRGMDAHKARIGLINAKGGVPLDRAREAAAEMGYLPMDTDVNDLLDLLDRDLRDGDVFSEQFADRHRVDFDNQRARLEEAINDHEYLRSLSNDEFAQLTNQQIADHLFGRSMEQGSFENPLPESEMESAPVGAWVAGPDLPGLDTRRVVMDVPLDRIDATEFDSAGELAPEKRADAARYAEAMAGGEQFPNGRGSELDSGLIKLQDGHRRYWAARESGATTLRLAVSPLTLNQPANFEQPAAGSFEERFGDSKVVDDQGQPLLVYHGTGRDFTEFKMGSAPGWGRGVYFTDNRDQAEADYGGGAGGRVVEAYLSIRNPWRGGFPGYEEVEGTQAWQAYTGSFEDSLDAWNEDGGFAGEVLRELGYDGVIAENSNDIRGLEIVAFDAAQIIPAAERDAQQQFDESSFRPAVVSWAKRTYGDAIAPNGNPVWQNFTAWFGDSQAVDAAGAPLVVFHGTAKDFDVFEGWGGMSFFSSDPEVSNEYAGAFRDGANLMPVYLSLKKPLVIDAKGMAYYGIHADKLPADLIERLRPGEIVGGRDGTVGLSTVATAAKAAGYDGVIANNLIDGAGSYGDQTPSNVYITFAPGQIKSATGNSGNFSPELASILEQPAYHGTPYDVDRFSLQKIGTGEGAQAYGWGLYFASQREVADFYRRNLTGIARNIPATMGDQALQEAGGDRGRAVATLTRRRDALPEAARGNTQAAIDWLRRGQDTGRLYQVDVPEDSDLLDWDKPYSEQPQKVRDALPVRIEKDSDGASDSKWVLLVGDKDVDGGRTRKELQEKVDSRAFGEIVMRGMGVFMGPKQTSEYLLAQGIPGLRYLDGDSRGSGGTHNYVIWDESAVSEPVRLNQSAINAPTFYSAALAAIESGRGAPKRGDAQAWKGWLDGAQRRGEMRQAERDWLGIDAWLDAQEGPVTREALAEFVRANQVQVDEVVLGDPAVVSDALNLWMEDQGFDPPESPEDWRDVVRRAEEDGEYGLAGEAAAHASGGAVQNGATKFATYQLPGGENYRELLLTLPTKDGDPLADKTREELGRLYEAEIGYNPIEDDPSISTEQLREDVRSLAPAAAAAGTSVGTGISGGRYRSSHWDQPDVLAHVRFNERTDADGKRVLFIEEIQSDWHQEGRKQGYARPDTPDAEVMRILDAEGYSARNNGANWVITAKNGGPVPNKLAGGTADSQFAANLAQVAQMVLGRTDLRAKLNATPDAPFKATDEWAMLAFKRMVRYAVDNGFERIAWTTGEQQAARYDLSKQVDTIAYAKDPDGLVTIEVFKDGRNQFNRRGMSMDEVEATVGKEVAQKIADDGGELNMRTGYSELSGLDLQVGGEGMRAFYDKILPSAVNKWAKKLGGRVGDTRIPSTENVGENAYVEPRVTGGYRARFGRDSASFETEQEAAAWLENARAMTVHALDLTDAMREAAAQGMTLFQKGGDTAPPRGQIQIFPDQSMMISLFEKADRSTFLHETGHFFLEVLRDMAAAPDAPEQAQADMAALLAWFGVESADQVGVEHHEQFARGFEKYLGEGRAPSPELQSAFSQFKAWLLSVYRALASLNVNLTDDVRGVMDRMLAADEEIEAAQVRQGMEPVTFGEGVLEDAELAKYAEMVTKATEEARAEVTARLMAAHDRAAKRWYREQKAEVRREVEGEYAALPVYRAARALGGAKTFADGTPMPEALHGLKLDKAALVAVYGDAYLQRLRGLYAVNGGVDQDVAAMRLGFESGDALVTALANREDMAARVDAETDERMRERHGDPMTDGTLAERAMDAAHNDHRMRVLAWEMAVLEALAADPAAAPDIPKPQREGQEGAQEARQPRPLSPEARARIKEASARRTAATRALAEAARRAIGKKNLRDIRPHDYLVAERKAARTAAAASAGGRYVEALQAKRQQAFNAALYREAKKIQARADANVRFLRKAASEKTRQRVGQQAGKFYVDALDAIFDGIEVRGASRPAVARRAALREWVARMQEDGNSTAVPEILLARVESERVTNLADMTADDVEGLREAVGNILHLAKTKNRLLTLRGAREWEQAKEEILAKLQEQPDRHGRHGISDADRALVTRLSDLYAAGSNWVLQPETLVEWLDNGTSGPFHDLLWDLAQAAERKREALNRMVGEQLKVALDAVPAADRKALDRRFRIESMGADVSGHSILSALLNMGNAGNRDKLLRGGRVVGDEIVPFTPEQLAEMFSKLTRPQAELVQKVWDAIDQLWPEIVALEEAMNGMSPERVESSQVTVITRDGPVALRGGYYPVMYDPKGARIGQFSEDEQAKRVLSGQTPIRASTSKGHTEARTDFAAPMLLDYQSVLSRHLDGVTGDIAYRQFLRQVYKVLGDADIRRMIDNRIGPGATVGLRKSFERGATGNFSLAGPLLGPFQKVADATMTNLSSAALGFRIPLALANTVAAPIQAGARVKTRYVLAGLRDYYLSGGPNVIANMKRNAEAVRRMSPLMLRRAEARSVELSSIIANLRGQRGFRAKMIESVMSVHQWTVPLAENAIWMGAYQQAQAAGMDMTDAINAADKAIRQTQTKTSAMELSQGEGGYLRMFMQFAGPLVIMNNRMQEAGLRGLRGDVKSWPQALGVWFAVAMGAAWSFELIMGRGPEGEDDEDPGVGDWIAWAAKKLALLPFSAFPIIREAASYADSGFSRGNPVAEAMNSLIDTYGVLAESVFGEEEVEPGKVVKQVTRAAGAATGIPSNQLLRTGDYLMSVGTGEHQLGNPAAEAYYLTQGAPDDE